MAPTLIYTSVVKDILKKIKVKALVNITGDGLLNLLRVRSKDIIIDNLPKIPYIFQYLQKIGNLSDRDMFQTFNMGIDFCVIVSEIHANTVKEICAFNNLKCWRIGYIEKSNVKYLDIPSKNLRGFKRQFFNTQ